MWKKNKPKQELSIQRRRIVENKHKSKGWNVVFSNKKTPDGFSASQVQKVIASARFADDHGGFVGQMI